MGEQQALTREVYVTSQGHEYFMVMKPPLMDTEKQGFPQPHSRLHFYLSDVLANGSQAFAIGSYPAGEIGQRDLQSYLKRVQDHLFDSMVDTTVYHMHPHNLFDEYQQDTAAC